MNSQRHLASESMPVKATTQRAKVKWKLALNTSSRTACTAKSLPANRTCGTTCSIGSRRWLMHGFMGRRGGCHGNTSNKKNVSKYGYNCRRPVWSLECPVPILEVQYGHATRRDRVCQIEWFALLPYFLQKKSVYINTLQTLTSN